MSTNFTFRGISTGISVTVPLADNDWAAAHAYGTALRLGSWGGEHSSITDEEESREIFTYDPPDQVDA